MKKLIFGLSFIAMTTALTIPNIISQSKDLTDAQRANIEALTAVETPGTDTREKYCDPNPNFNCIIYWKVSGSTVVNSTTFFGYWDKQS